MLTYVIVIFSVKYQFSLASSLLRIADNQCSNLSLSSIKTVESEMTTDRLIFSSRFVALMFAVISARRFDELNDDENDSSASQTYLSDFFVFKLFSAFSRIV